MLNEIERRRFYDLRNRDAEGLALTAEEADAVAEYVRRIENAESAYLGPATSRMKAENAAAEERVRALTALIEREERFITRLNRTVAELREEQEAMIVERQRLAVFAPPTARL